MTMIEHVLWTSAHLGALALVLLSAGGIGHLFLRKLQFDSLVERLVFTLSLGLGLSALLIFALGLVGLLYRQLLFGLSVAGAVATLAYLIHLHKRRGIPSLPRWRDLASPRLLLKRLLVILGLSYWGLLLLSTQYPPVHWDAISYHLVLSREYLEAHRLVPVMGVTWPVLPALNHMLFSWGLALQDDILAQMIEHTFLMLTAWGLYAWGRRQRRPLFGLAVGAVMLAHPLVLWLAESAYVDVCLMSYVFLGVYALRIFWQSLESRWWYLAMALLAMAAGAKISGQFFVIVGCALGVWPLARHYFTRKRWSAETGEESKATAPNGFTWKSLVRGWVVAFVVLAPWYAYFTYYTGNPAWPALSQFSRGVWGSPELVENMSNWYKNAAEPRTLKNFLILPIDWIRYPARFYAEVGLTLYPLIIAWPMAWIVALWDRSVRWWVLWALSFTFYWFLFAHQLRYWLPALPFAMLALYESIRWTIDKISNSAKLHAAVWILLAVSAAAWGGRAIVNEVRVKGWPPTNPDSREVFLSTLNGYNAVKYVNKQADKDDTVCVINASWLDYYFKTNVLDLFAPIQSGKLPTFQWPDDEQWVRWLESQNITWIVVNHAGAPGYLNIPKRNIVLNPIWPDYQLVYSDKTTWVFRHKPVPPELGLRLRPSRVG